MLWEGYGMTKNKLAAKAAYSWILSLDGDEVPDPKLLAAIARLPCSNAGQDIVYALKRLSFFEGRKIQYGAWGRDKVLRLYHKAYTQWNPDIVHETLELKPGTRVVQLEGTLLRYTADNYESFLKKNKQYARLSADKYFQQGKEKPFMEKSIVTGFYLYPGIYFPGGLYGWRRRI